MKRVLIVGAVLALGVATSGCGFFPSYRIMQAEGNGRAQLAQANGNRQIKRLEAQANLEAAKLNAEAEVVRARGTDQANRIMAQSLGGPQNYLTWSYIDMLRDTAGKGQTIIYVPTEAGIPILEAARAPK